VEKTRIISLPEFWSFLPMEVDPFYMDSKQG
jgi:hypothetical protein